MLVEGGPLPVQTLFQLIREGVETSWVSSVSRVHMLNRYPGKTIPRPSPPRQNWLFVSGQLTDGREALCGWWGSTGRHDEAFRICREVALVLGSGGGNGGGGGGVNEGAGFAGGGCVTSSK